MTCAGQEALDVNNPAGYLGPMYSSASKSFKTALVHQADPSSK